MMLPFHQSVAGEVPTTRIGVHALDINLYLHEFFEPMRNLAVFEGSNISETEEVTPTKIGVHVCHMCLYLHDLFEPIPID